MPDTQGREREISEVARRLADLSGRQRSRVAGWGDRLLLRSMADPAFRTRLFRFVDCFPALRDDAEIEEHLRSEFEGVDVPRWFGAGLGLTRSVPGGGRLSANVARRAIDRIARQFIVGTGEEEVARAVGAMWQRHSAATVDLLGEHTYSGVEADRYVARLTRVVETLGAAARGWPRNDLLERDDLGPLPRASVSIKASALASSFAPLSAEEGIEQAAHRLLPVLRRAKELGLSAWFDTERYEEKDLTHRLALRVLSVPGLEELHAGVVVQSYLHDSAEDLELFASWARGRRTPLSVRLVKGAYWDTETAVSAARGWPSPVFESKAHTDSNYERLALRLLEHHGALRPAFATHNLRSLAAAIVDADGMGLAQDAYELQLLYGMAEPLHEALRRTGLRLRIYCPVGELIPGMAYLVRRLLENTSNESFVRHRFVEGESLDELLVPPPPGPPSPPARAARRARTDPLEPGPYTPEPPAQWHLAEVTAEFKQAVESEFAAPARQIPALVGGAKLRTTSKLVSVDPADAETVVAEARACSEREVEAAVTFAQSAAGRWGGLPAAERAAVLFGAAEHLRSRREQIAALEVREVGKGWADADAEVCEAIDYCEYYGRRMLELASGGEVQSTPGESNVLLYRPKGVCAVIAPWNFPLAIPAGMTAAALVAGNSVVLKPAEQAPAVAFELVKAFTAAGLPPGTLGFLPGGGEEVGAPLAAHPGVDVIAFTGSREVGLSIVESASERRAGRRSIPRVVAELGGKNAIVVDSDADIDEVVPAVVGSAFGFAGQKCSAASRLVVVSAVHDEVVRRVVDAARSLVIGPPRSPGTHVGPVIDSAAYERLRAAKQRARDFGTVVLDRSDVPESGWYVGPTVVTGVDPGSWLATEELFGPVLAVFEARDFAEALELANRGDYALTAGVFSRSRDHVRQASRVLRAGNLYVNRSITGAVVGRQPFGGNGMSGVGSKAGGPDYLLEFLDAQVVAENTTRHGFAPEVLDRKPLDTPQGPGGDLGGLAGGRGVA